MKSRRKFAKIFSIHVKNPETSGPYNFGTPIKATFLIFENESAGPWLFQKLGTVDTPQVLRLPNVVNKTGLTQLNQLKLFTQSPDL